MTRGGRPALKVDVLVASDRWKDTEKVKSLVRRAVTRSAAATLSTSAAELAIVLTDDSAIRLLNRDWRGVDAATNVLSFPAKNANSKHLVGHLGDIVLAFETIANEARAERKPIAHHIAHLAVHGFLHLVGYDHDNEKDALEMERTEREILQELAIPDPYRPRPRSKVHPGKTGSRTARSRPSIRRRARTKPVKLAGNSAGRSRRS